MTEKFERIVKFRPAYDKRNTGPAKNYGIGSMDIFFILKGERGAVQFRVGTDWYTPNVQRNEQKTWNDISSGSDIKPKGYDLGYHSPTPMFDGHSPMPECSLMEPCYYDGSSLNAEAMIPDFLEGGTNWLWGYLEDYYRSRFVGDESDQ